MLKNHPSYQKPGKSQIDTNTKMNQILDLVDNDFKEAVIKNFKKKL